MSRVCLLLFVLFVFSSCTKKYQLLSKAKSDAKEMIEKKKMDPDNFNRDIRLEDMTPVYCSDSLCILYLDIKHKNALGIDITQKAEFVHFGDGWFLHAPDGDKDETTIYLPEELFDKEKKGKIYENFSYDDAIYYRAALSYNKMTEDGRLEIPLRTGLWELRSYKNDYNEDTNSKYLLLCSYDGVEKNKESDVKAELIVDKDGICFRFLKKLLSDYSPIADYGEHAVSIENSNGETYGPWYFRATDNNLEPSKNKKVIIESLQEMLRKGDNITIMLRVDNFWIKSNFRFKMNLTGYEEVKKYLEV